MESIKRSILDTVYEKAKASLNEQSYASETRRAAYQLRIFASGEYKLNVARETSPSHRAAETRINTSSDIYRPINAV